MQKWEYRKLHLYLETWKRGQEHYKDYVLTYADGTRLEGLEMVLSRYLDDGGWELVSIVPTGFTQMAGQGLVADTLTVIFRRKLPF
jgi:hypothetical protein